MTFKEDVFELTKKIPKGKVSTYKQLAILLNCKAYRAVGNALNKNNSNLVPCHRVVRSDGSIGGFRTGTKNKIKLLKKEGLIIKNNKINLDEYFF